LNFGAHIRQSQSAKTQILTFTTEPQDWLVTMTPDDEATNIHHVLCAHSAEMRLKGKKLDEEGAKRIAEQLKTSTTLTRLYLERACIGNEGALIIADALQKNCSLLGLIIGIQ
jgi:hypothetical protein